MIRSMSYAGATIVGAALALTAPGTSEAGTTSAGPYTVALQTGDQVTVADPAGTRVSVKPGAVSRCDSLTRSHHSVDSIRSGDEGPGQGLG